MNRRWGLRARMAASYVLATAAAVVVVEAVLLGVVVPGLIRGDSQALVDTTATEYANQAAQASTTPGKLPSAAEFTIGDPAVHLRPGQAAVAADRHTVLIPYISTVQIEPGPMSMALLIGTDNRIVASSYPARFRIGDPALVQLPSGVADLSAPDAFQKKLKGTGRPGDTPSGKVIWSVALVLSDVSRPGTANG